MGLMSLTTRAQLLELLNVEKPTVTWMVKAELIAGEETVVANNVVSQKVTRLYHSAYTDINFITVQLGRTTYNRFVLPNKNKMKLRLTMTLRNPGQPVAPANASYYRIFDAHLVDPENSALMPKSKLDNEAELTELSETVDISYQLTDPLMGEIRLAETGGIYEKADFKSVLKVLMGYGLEGRKTVSGLDSLQYEGCRGVDVIEPNNNKVYDYLPIPMGTRLVDLPKYLQNEFGVYSSGIGYYLQAGHWYIYPLLDFTRFKPTSRTLTVVIVPKDEMLGIEKTYMVRSQQLFVFCTGDVTVNDISEKTLNNEGSAISFSKASDLVDGFVKNSGNKSTPNKDTNVRKFSLEDRAIGLTNTKRMSKFTDNPYKATSELAMGLGRQLNLTWENSDPRLLFPGMPVKVLYTQDGELKSVLGTLLGNEYLVAPSTARQLDNEYLVSTGLTLQIEKED